MNRIKSKELQPESKVEQDKKGEYICSFCGNYLVPFYEQDGLDDYRFSGSFYKCNHEKEDD